MENELLPEGNAIVSVDEIQQIIVNYNIGKKPLARLLGWGETTIIRYLEGDTPTTEYSDKLQAILQNPTYYYSILMRNKENLTNVAFRKSKKAVLERVMKSKIDVVAQYIINLKDSEVSAGYIQVLLFYIQVFSLAFYGREMFDDECFTLGNSSPYPNVYKNMKKYGMVKLEMEDSMLEEDEKELIHAVIDGFTWYGPKALFALLERESRILNESVEGQTGRYLTKEVLKNYYKEALIQYNIGSISEIGRYPDITLTEIRRDMMQIV
ncbi:type II toxin-antitoxin system antitoxin SocA domain-containing protein [Anaerosporobacter sp.]|uniref:type II toxin-antitoxin system antitoxin SocA domain-containing protein n=1 Tax=Anaerosporobacter sp. TaxID=1872529 RepID=UPI00286F1668|nr:type II toxin-antitoxin system antitoxin SocA domain-containing protein [Anaerosporobacter sp.]